MLLRDILDPHLFTIQIARLTRERNYDDELQSYDHPHPPNAPEWSYIEQIDQVYDTEIEGEFYQELSSCVKLLNRCKFR